MAAPFNRSPQLRSEMPQVMVSVKDYSIQRRAVKTFAPLRHLYRGSKLSFTTLFAKQNAHP